MKLHPKILLLALAILPWFANDARACSCMMPGPPCQEYWRTPVVFDGVVVSISQASVDSGDGNAPRAYSQRLVRFSIEQAFRGVEGKEVEAITGMGGGDCGYEFKPGERYLVYAHRNPNDNKLSVGICSRTRPLSEASDDLEYIRSLAKAAPGGRIFGEVKQFVRDLKNGNSESRNPMADARVIIEGQSKRYEIITDGEGRYEKAGLAPGEYQVRLVVPEYLGGHIEEKVNVPDRGCITASFYVQLDGRVGGTVTDGEGKPAPNVRVQLIVADPVNKESSILNGETAFTDEAGRYKFGLIPPGRYLLGINLIQPPDSEQPYPRIYYPGVNDETQARIIAMGNGSKLDDYDFHLPPRLTERVIEGVVAWPKGRSGVRILVSLEPTEYPWWSLRQSVEADEQGRFSIKALEGVKYLLTADMLVDNRSYMYAEPVPVTANEKTGPIRLSITLMGSSHFRNQLRK